MHIGHGIVVGSGLSTSVGARFSPSKEEFSLFAVNPASACGRNLPKCGKVLTLAESNQNQ